MATEIDVDASRSLIIGYSVRERMASGDRTALALLCTYYSARAYEACCLG